MQTEKPLVDDVTPDMINIWKEEHKRVKEVKLKSVLSGVVSFIIAKPTRPQLDVIAKYTDDGKQDKVREVMERSCVKAGPVDKLAGDIDLQNMVYEKITSMFDKPEVVSEKEL